MCEHHIGAVPNCGTSYHLSHIKDDAFGLYLFLTSKCITGSDCYFSGISQFFMKEENLKYLHSDLTQECESLLNVIEKYMTEPTREDNFYLRFKDEIDQAFSNANHVEEIIERLYRNKTQFSIETAKELETTCPLTLKIAIRQFKAAKSRTLDEALKSEYEIDCNLYCYKNENYRLGVKKKMLDKAKDKPEWIPRRLEDVTDEIINQHMNPDKLLSLIN